jgi:Protein of unknown function (DUF4242)
MARKSSEIDPGISLISGIPALPWRSSVAREGRTGVPTYLVERYWPGVTSELLLEALSRGRRVIEQMSAEGTRVRDITSVLVPGEEVVFSVYQGPSVEAVRQLNERAGIRVSRIVEAIWVSGDQGDHLGVRVAQDT